MSTTVTGEITTILGALDQGIYDPGGLQFLTIAGPTFEEESFPGEFYRTFHPTGLAVLYKKKRDKERASSVFIYIVAQDGAEPYPTPDQLFDGFGLSTASRDDIRAHLGEVVWSEKSSGPFPVNFDIFQVNDRFLNFSFNDDDTLNLITAMIEVPGL